MKLFGKTGLTEEGTASLVHELGPTGSVNGAVVAYEPLTCVIFNAKLTCRHKEVTAPLEIDS